MRNPKGDIRFNSSRMFGGKKFVFWTFGPKDSVKSTAKYLRDNNRGYTRITKVKLDNKIEYVLWVHEK